MTYEQSLTRMDSTFGLYYDCSAHMLWLGTAPDGAQVKYLRGVANPLRIKVFSPSVLACCCLTLIIYYLYQMRSYM